MTEQTKKLLVRYFLLNRKLHRAKNDTTAKRYAEEMAELYVEILGHV